MRIIDADALIRKYIDTDIEKFSNSDVKIVLENLKQNILKAPSIDIVFCKECKRGKWYCINGEFYLWCRPNIKRVKENDFCSCGKRRKP